MSEHNNVSANSGSSSIQRILQQLETGDDAPLPAETICLNNLYLTDPQHDREELLIVKGGIAPGTCSWILSTPEYTQWYQGGPGSKDLLWICGGPGSGKTMLSIYLSKHLEDAANTEDAAQPHLTKEDLILTFHCSGSETAKNSETGILRGLLFQAVSRRPSLLGRIQQVYENQCDDVLQHWSFDMLWMALRTIIRGQSEDGMPGSEVEDMANHQHPVAYIIVDGLDECELVSVRKLIRKLSRLTEDKQLGGRVKVMLVSRENPALRDALAGRCLQLDFEEPNIAQAVRADVHRHIFQQVDELARPERKHYSTELSISIKEYLVQKSQANFLWVSMAITELEFTSRIEAWEHLSRLPPTLDAMYEWMVMQIPHGWRELSTKVLLWVTLALRPLSITELVVALDERRLSLTDYQTVRDCVDRCGQMLRTDADDKVHLIHPSAREYLLGRLKSSPSFFKDCIEVNPFNLKEGQRLIASICIENLTSVAPPPYQDLGRHKIGRTVGSAMSIISTPTALSNYAKGFWTDHVRASDELMLDIVDSNPQLFEEHSLPRGILAYEASKGLLTVDIPVLHHAAYHGFLPLVDRLLKKGWRNRRRRRRLVAQRDGLDRTALHLAVHRQENGPTVKLLLDRGVDVYCKDYTGATALDHAIKYGTAEIVSLLHAHGQQV